MLIINLLFIYNRGSTCSRQLNLLYLYWDITDGTSSQYFTKIHGNVWPWFWRTTRRRTIWQWTISEMLSKRFAVVRKNYLVVRPGFGISSCKTPKIGLEVSIFLFDIINLFGTLHEKYNKLKCMYSDVSTSFACNVVVIWNKDHRVGNWK